MADVRERPRILATIGRRALLAQLVEHFHGKEGVAGSSPAEGFIGTPRYGGDFCLPGRFRLRRSAALWVLSGSHRVPLRDPAMSPSQIARWGFDGLADKASDVAVKTPFDDLDPSAVLKPKDIAARLDVDARSVR